MTMDGCILKRQKAHLFFRSTCWVAWKDQFLHKVMWEPFCMIFKTFKNSTRSGHVFLSDFAIVNDGFHVTNIGKLDSHDFRAQNGV